MKFKEVTDVLESGIEGPEDLERIKQQCPCACIEAVDERQYFNYCAFAQGLVRITDPRIVALVMAVKFGQMTQDVKTFFIDDETVCMIIEYTIRTFANFELTYEDVVEFYEEANREL